MSKTIKRILFIFPILSLIGCSASSSSDASSSFNSSKTSQSISSEIPNSVLIKSFAEVDMSLNSCYGGEISINNIQGISGTLNFYKSDEYLLDYKLDNGKINGSTLLKNDGQNQYKYTKSESSNYNRASRIDLDETTSLNPYVFTKFNGTRIVYKEKSDVTFIGRPCTQYLLENSGDSELPISITIDNSSNFCFKAEIGDPSSSQYQKYEVISFSTSNDIKQIVEQEIDKIVAEPINDSLLKSVGFNGQIKGPTLLFNQIEVNYIENTLDSYYISYKDRRCMGNDSYINQFETLSKCIFDLGFDNNESSMNNEFEKLFFEDSNEEETKHVFNAYASKNNKKYSVNSYLSIKGEYAIIDFRFSTIK